MLDIIIDGKVYDYVSSVKIDDKSYLAYSDGWNTYISEFTYQGDSVILTEVDDKTFNIVKEILT